MIFRQIIVSIRFDVVIWFFLCMINIGNCNAQEVNKVSLSLRTGFLVNNNDEGFRQYDVFTDFLLQAISSSQSSLNFNIRLDAVASILTQRGESAFLFSLGPAFLLQKKGSRLTLKFGSSPTFLSDARFPDKNLGGHFHFISHIGVILRIGQKWGLVYRIQHLSNASIVQPNPGLNLQIIGVRILLN